VPLDAGDLAVAIRDAAGAVRPTVDLPDGSGLVLRFGEQTDVQPTLGAIRRERSDHRRQQSGQHAREIGDQDDEQPIVARWQFAGIGYLTDGDAALALSAATRARERRQAARESQIHSPSPESVLRS